MTKYRKASEKTIARGKGKSTDQLSLADAKEYFNSRAKETGAKRFRWKGDVYDLSGNKVNESKGSGTRSPSLSRDEGPKRPRANPARQPGGARPEPGKAGGMPAASGKGKPESPGKRGEVNPYAVAGMAAAGVGAGVAAARSGRKPSSGSGTSISDRVRAAGAKAKSVAMGVPAKPPAKAATPTTTTPTPSTPPTTKAPKGGARVGGVRVVGGNPVRRAIGAGAAGRNMRDMRFDPLFLNFNKGGMVKKKK